VDQFYEKAGSLFVEAYDAFYGGSRPQIAGDVAFYERLARGGGGAVLEVGCGTGRITVPLAQAGLEVTGVDLSEAMLAIARRKFAALPTSVQAHVNLINQDMTALNLGRCFNLVFLPFRSFQHVLTIDLQRKALKAIRRHLEPTGRLALHLFDPRLDFLCDANNPRQGFPALILRRVAAMSARFCKPISTTSIKCAVTSGGILKSVPTAECWPTTHGKWRCAGPIAGSCITSLGCAVSRSRRSTAISSDPHRHMAENWFWWREVRELPQCRFLARTHRTAVLSGTSALGGRPAAGVSSVDR
jgi:SAM-dependent methyltransferase